MDDLRSLRARAVTALLPLSRPRLDPHLRRRLTAAFRPTAADHARVFTDAVAPLARDAWTRFWRDPPSFGPDCDDARLTLDLATARDFAGDTPAADAFPPGYREIAHALQPDVPWVAWCYVGPDGRGTAFDGLVWSGSRFVWLPQPAAFLHHAVRASAVAVAEHWVE